MRQMTSKRIGSHRLSTLRRQKGVSLIPALITICIFTLLATQVVIPNQNRNLRETNINAVASSVEQLIQASYAYRAASGSPPSWPTSIDNGTAAGDLVPNYLPVFNDRTPWGDTWTIDNTGGFHFKTDTKNVDIARALVQKIGSYARLGPSNNGEVQIFPGMSAAPTLDDLNITGTFQLGSSLTSGTFILNGIDITTALGTGTGTGTGSSKRFKENIHPLDISIKSIYQLNPVSFDYKDAFKQYKTPNATNKEIGLIAEQVLPLIPEITLVDDDKVMGIDYTKLSILLLKAIQELNAEFTSLKQSNQQLQQQINNLTLPSPLHESNKIKKAQ